MANVNGVNFQRFRVDVDDTLTIAAGFVMVANALFFEVRGLVVCRGFIKV